jgi:two-component system, sensor histidine kinase and response regulator
MAIVLVVDDDSHIRESVSAILESDGHLVEAVGDGEAALAWVARSLPDVMVLDLAMPGLGGLETCRRVRAMPAARHMPIIVLTGLDARAHALEALDAGADEFIAKPAASLDLRCRVRSMVRLKQQFDRVREASRLREDLAQVLVHDMRNPITTILGNAALLQAGGAPVPPDDPRLARIGREATRLSSLVDEVLVVSRLEAARLVVRRRPLDLPALARTAVDRCGPLLEARRARATVDAPAALSIEGDERLLLRVVENLLANAAKYGPAGGEVQVRVAADGPRAALTVADDGPGIPPEHAERVFEKFHALEVKELPAARQSGLGLYFCRLVTEAHGGRIRVDAARTRGAALVVELPLPAGSA